MKQAKAVVGARTRRPDFRIRRGDESWTYVEVTRAQLVMRSFIVFSSNDDIHLGLRRCRQDRRRPTIERGGFSRRARAGLTKKHFTLLPWLPERLLPLFESHRSRVA